MEEKIQEHMVVVQSLGLSLRSVARREEVGGCTRQEEAGGLSVWTCLCIALFGISYQKVRRDCMHLGSLYSKAQGLRRQGIKNK
jgi:hypothetical protein